MANLYSILFVFLLHLFPTDEAKVTKGLSTFENPDKQAENFIRELNLFPELDVNIVAYETNITERPRLVEKPIQFSKFFEPDNYIHYVGQSAGYFRLPHSKNARMFYYFFGARSQRHDEPVVVWLTGGPGCSGSVASFYENGPFHIRDDLTLALNDFGWDTVSNLIFVDQPIGTGFSSTSSKRDIRKSTKQASVDFYDFLQAFFQKHPRYRNNDLYITGESYAGHYIPAFLAHIHQANRKVVSGKINLKGMAIGNGLTNPEIQYRAYADYAMAMKMINQSHYNSLSKYSVCRKWIKGCEKVTYSCSFAYESCKGIRKSILQANNGINYYDIRKRCEGPLCYDFSKMKNFAARIPAMLADGIKLLVYAGEYDLMCNWIGILAWVTEMDWSGQRKFISAPQIPFMVDGLKAGQTKSHGPLTFLKVYNAGHMVPMDQPKASLEMIKRWMQGQSL